MDEQSERSGETLTVDTQEYKFRTISILNNIIPVLYPYSDTYDKYAVSVDQVETWTGFDYFANLPDAIETTAETNASWTTFKNF
jgi:DNA/RNA endonuclease G (NUC1)